LDRRPAFKPNMTIVFPGYQEKTQMCEWKEQDPYCHVDSITLLQKQTWSAINDVIKEQEEAGVVL